MLYPPHAHAAYADNAHRFLVPIRHACSRSLRAPAVVTLRSLFRDIAFGDIAREQRRISVRGIAVAASACTLQEETLAGAQLIAPGCRHVPFFSGPCADDKTAAAARFAAGNSVGRKARPVVAPHHARVLQQFIGAAERESAAELAGTAGIGRQLEGRDAA